MIQIRCQPRNDAAAPRGYLAREAQRMGDRRSSSPERWACWDSRYGSGPRGARLLLLRRSPLRGRKEC